MKALDRFRNLVRDFELPADWDEEGAAEITAETCATALEFMEAALLRYPDVPLPMPAASVLGGVSLHWRAEDQLLTIRITDRRQAWVLRNGPGDERLRGWVDWETALEYVGGFV